MRLSCCMPSKCGSRHCLAKVTNQEPLDPGEEMTCRISLGQDFQSQRMNRGKERHTIDKCLAYMEGPPNQRIQWDQSAIRHSRGSPRANPEGYGESIKLGQGEWGLV